MHRRSINAFFLAALMLVCTAHAADRTFALDIPAESLQSALGAFADQTGLQVVYETDLAKGLSSPAIKGKLTVREALARLLRGTGLASRFLNDHAIAISSTTKGERPSSTPGKKAQAPAPLGQADMTQVPAPAEPATDLPALEEIVVTGSHIRGAQNTGSPVLVMTREDIDQTGYTTVHDILNTLTPISGAGPSEILQSDTEGGSAFDAGGSINIRGLGAGSTLVLVNGRRQAAGGLEGRYVDVSTIPTTAIERIEILTDGASAVYGSDAVAGVVNIILRKDFEGAETRLRVGNVSGGADEILVGQLFGKSWGSGNVMASYQYWERKPLANSARSFAADTDKRPLGGDNFSPITSKPGNILDPITGGPAYAIPAGQDGHSLTPDQLLKGVINYQNQWEQTDLLPEQKMHSVFVSGSQRLGDGVELHADGSFSQRDMQRRQTAAGRTLKVPSSNPFFVSPFDGATSVSMAYSFIDDLGPRITTSTTQTMSATVGGTVEIGDGWEIDVDTTYGADRMRWNTTNLVNAADLNIALADTNPETAFDPFGDGSNTSAETLDHLRMTQIEHDDSSTWSTTAIAQGGVVNLPGGEVKLAVGGDYRQERLDRLEALLRHSGNLVLDPGPVTRDVASAFVEMQLPLVGKPNHIVGIEQMLLSLAGRYEEYSDFGTTFNPKFGLSWYPLSSVHIRATAGTSFQAPNLFDMNEDSILYPNSASLLLVNDPKSSTGFSKILALTGPNQDLTEERATTWTAGLDLNPQQFGGLNLSLTYFHIVYKNQIERGGSAPISAIFSQEALWAPIITRNPSRSTVESICSQASFTGSLEDCLTGALPTIVDARVRNLGELRLQGIDASLKYPIQTNYGTWSLTMDASYLLRFDRAITSTSPFYQLVDTVGEPVRLRLRAAAGWVYRGLHADMAVNYQNSYTDTVSSPARPISAYTTVDARAAYTFAHKGTEVALSITNLTDEAPPFVNSIYGYDPANASPIGRAVSLELTQSW